MKMMKSIWPCMTTSPLCRVPCNDNGWLFIERTTYSRFEMFVFVNGLPWNREGLKQATKETIYGAYKQARTQVNWPGQLVQLTTLTSA